MDMLVLLGFLILSFGRVQGEDSLIVGGREVYPPGTYPWQGSLWYRPVLGEFSHTCGCVYIGDKWVLTAAHCVHGTPVDRLRVVLGAHDIKTQIEAQPETFDVIDFTMNPDWEYVPDLGYPNDIAVVELSGTPDADNAFIRALEVPPPGRTEDDWLDMECRIIGWGRLYGGIADLPNMLQEAPTWVISQAYCAELWTPTPIGDYHVCILDTENQDTAACSGDSGGPLVCRESAEEPWELVGLTSWGFAGCNTRFPSVYAKVSLFSDWIAEVTGNASD